ncbi:MULTISPECIES: hypothetical protein [unclassified Streptomyces]|uniref:hypothetical protein n=1 Tax=unclassified Streptomyces TaxID=2593676 RepID=UPI002E2E6689|nr:hypothetical protein [Streptomyces sp. NBC_01429]
MSQSVPPTGNPFADNADNAGAPAPYAPPPVNDSLGLGLAAAFVAALVAAAVYGGIAGAMEREIGWAAVGVGFLTGFAAGKVGGPNPVLPVVSALLSLAAVYVGQLFEIAIIIAKSQSLTATEILFRHTGELNTLWKEGSGVMTFLFFALAAFAAFSGARKAAA